MTKYLLTCQYNIQVRAIMSILEILVFLFALTSIPFLFVLLFISSTYTLQFITSFILKPDFHAFKQFILWLVISWILAILLITAMSIVRLYLDWIIGQIYIFIVTC